MNYTTEVSKEDLLVSVEEILYRSSLELTADSNLDVEISRVMEERGVNAYTALLVCLFNSFTVRVNGPIPFEWNVLENKLEKMFTGITKIFVSWD